ncbi:hypothetical protein KC973_00170 [Candidatus Saccharibacteria bacterium]|nr:hypothetical protein [Candidatus Saccharibacteria bacterium]
MSKLKHLLISLVASASLFIIFSGSTQAASFTVADGNDENTDNSSCSLTEAITNINAQSTDEPDCVPTGAYGTDDTINLPAGIITLTGELDPILESVTIAGEGIGQSVIDGDDGTYPGVTVGGSGTESVALIEMTIQNVDGTAVLVRDANLLIDQLEVYGSSDQIGSNTGIEYGIRHSNDNGNSLGVDIGNTYVHHLTTSEDELAGFFFENQDVNGSHTEINLDNVTVDNMDSDTSLTTHGILFSGFEGLEQTMDVSASNVTISNISGSQLVNGLAAVVVAATGDSVMNLDVRNMTITGIAGSTSIYADSSAFSIGGAALNNSLTAAVTVNASNLLLAQNTIDNTPANCLVTDMTPLVMGTGTPELSLTSNGGNLSDDTTCSSYFTQPTDQNNVTNLALTLGTLGDYGGSVPTIPLLEGSPAIDAGVTVAGLASDARGVSRPLGLAYDSGAYESPFTKTVEGTETLASTGQNIKLVSFFAALLLALGLMLQLRRHYV